MFSAALFSTLALLPFISATKIHDVIVGGPGVLLYHPEYVHAQVGEYVRFHFKQKNHTATQSSLSNPCTPLPYGFDSGFMPVPDGQVDGFPYYDVEVKDTAPTWVHCQQTNHCAQGMVFAINPGEKFVEFKHNAMATPIHHKVVVGGDAGNVYTPNRVHAKKGDVITFEFRQKNHTLTQSSFDDPCRKLEFTSKTGEIGFDSGFMPVPPEQVDHFPTWTYTVYDDTKPVWAYCRQTGHCGQGMVFAVNSDDKSFDAFMHNAIRINGTAPAAARSLPTGGWSAKFGRVGA